MPKGGAKAVVESASMEPPSSNPGAPLTVIALLELRHKPDAVEPGRALLNEILVDTRAFAGNLGVDVLTDLADAAHVTVVETWASIDDDLAYRQWRTTPAGASSLGTVLAGVPVLTKFSRASI
ncbi:MAG: hypothetical protein JWM76_1186 [Pseudonocardiales bacterium]|nr:hypothetical protein [Pseudonocardiales bacterium]